ncbi:anaphase promoting complex subunit 5 [Maudiozyma exigua]|uniref:Anaphase-promoting complex subunit 5 n=1 Tax=Maudiozyma exigua TaxID=34358 RepID=A0A9P7BAZ8_MAUEX|nr:anaphase promoting complex subunit 5 [Kazachstania exigua]
MNFKVTLSLTPYDLVVIVAVYLHCLQDANIPLEVFQELICPTIEPSPFDPLIDRDVVYPGLTDPLIPDLCVITRRLSEIDGFKDMVEAYIGCVTSIKTLETVYNMLKAVKFLCLVKTAKDLKERRKENESKSIVCFTERSFLGNYIVKCLMKVEIGSFDDKIILFDCFKKMVSEFMDSEIRIFYGWHIPNRTSSLKNWGLMTDEYNDNEKMIKMLGELTHNIERNEAPDLIISANHLENILDWYLYKKVKKAPFPEDDPSQNLVTDMINNISLHNKSLFPKINVIKYLMYLDNNCYDDAFKALHNYFDYVLSQNADSYFHISSLCIATFYTHFHDTELAVKSFDEATKVAREHRDSDTLNLIIVWIMKFIEDRPEHAAQFNLKVDQITRFLKSSSDSTDARIFESAYRFEALTLFRRHDDKISLFEALYRYTVLAMEQHKSEGGMSDLMQFKTMLWQELGFPKLAEIYDKFAKQNENSKELDEMFVNLEQNKLDLVKRYLKCSKFQTFGYDDRMRATMLKVRYLRTVCEYDMAFSIVEDAILECTAYCSDFRMKNDFEIEKCLLFLDSNLGCRCLHLAIDLLKYNQLIQNGPTTVKCIFILYRVLMESCNFEDAQELLEENIVNIMQYSEFREQAGIYRKAVKEALAAE